MKLRRRSAEVVLRQNAVVVGDSGEELGNLDLELADGGAGDREGDELGGGRLELERLEGGLEVDGAGGGGLYSDLSLLGYSEQSVQQLRGVGGEVADLREGSRHLGHVGVPCGIRLGGLEGGAVHELGMGVGGGETHLALREGHVVSWRRSGRGGGREGRGEQEKIKVDEG